MQTGGGREKIWQRTKEGWKEGWREYTRDEKISGEDINKGDERSHVKTIGRRKLVGGYINATKCSIKSPLFMFIKI